MDSVKNSNVDDIKKSLKQFGLTDYIVFGFMLIVCSVIGIYFGLQDHKRNKKRRVKASRGSVELNYLVGGRNLEVFPVAMSLVASGLSGITLLGELKRTTCRCEPLLKTNRRFLLRNSYRSVHLWNQHHLHVLSTRYHGLVHPLCCHSSVLRPSDCIDLRGFFIQD